MKGPHSQATKERLSAGFTGRHYSAVACCICAKQFNPRHPRRRTCSTECKKTQKHQIRTQWMATVAGKASTVRSKQLRRQQYAANRKLHKRSALRLAYGMTLEEWGVLFGQQEGRCPICCDVLDRGKGTHVDHSHISTVIRGLLCGRCNVAIGMLRDDPLLMRAAARYLERHAMAKVKSA